MNTTHKQRSSPTGGSKPPDPIKRIGDMWNQTTGQWMELGMRFRNGKPRGKQLFWRARPDPITEGPSTGQGIWKPVFQDGEHS